MAVPTEMVQLQNWGIVFSLYLQYSQLLFSIGAPALDILLPYLIPFAGIINAKLCIFCKKRKILYKIIILWGYKIYHTDLAKSPANRRTKNWLYFLYRKVHIPVKTPPFTTT